MAVPFCQANPTIQQCLSVNNDSTFNVCPPAFYYIVYPPDTTTLLSHEKNAGQLCGANNQMINDNASSYQDSNLGSFEEDLSTPTIATDDDSVSSISRETPDTLDEDNTFKGIEEKNQGRQEEQCEEVGEQECSDGDADQLSLNGDGRGSQPGTNGDPLSYSYLENSGYFHNLNARTKKIFVGGLSASTREEDIKDYFSSYGEVNECTLMIDRQTNRHRGFAFVTFQSEEVVEEVCSKQFHEIRSKMVEAKKAEPREVFFPKASMHSLGNRQPPQNVNGYHTGPHLPRGSWKGSFFNPVSGPGGFPPFPNGPFPPPVTMPFPPFPPTGPHIYPPPSNFQYPPPVMNCGWFLPLPQFPFPPAPGLPYSSLPMSLSPPPQSAAQGGVPYTMYNGTAYFSLPGPKYIQ